MNPNPFNQLFGSIKPLNNMMNSHNKFNQQYFQQQNNNINNNMNNMNNQYHSPPSMNNNVNKFNNNNNDYNNGNNMNYHNNLHMNNDMNMNNQNNNNNMSKPIQQNYNFNANSNSNNYTPLPNSQGKIPIMPSQQYIPQYNTSINIQSLSPKQLLCQCIDLATSIFKQITDSFVKINNLPSPYQGKKVIDFSLLANFMLEPTRLEKILSQFLTSDDQSVKSLVKSWIFQMKYIRNLWAHSQKITYRLACRGYDTLGLLFQSFGGDQNSELFQKIQTYRKALLIVQAKLGFNS